ncbi:hypothetical protein [Microbacterium sp. HMWF026]|uniref:hypothetical protein n=1 Tax=Microbacterium sp. HMWF026 TaxID=2056861 RepID=UPI0011B1FFF3|nr:hypothetical protein [Microbacterium sp. HMWF026]
MDLARGQEVGRRDVIVTVDHLEQTVVRKPPGRFRAGKSAETIEKQPSPTSTTSSELRGNRAPTDIRKPGAYN